MLTANVDKNITFILGILSGFSGDEIIFSLNGLFLRQKNTYFTKTCFMFKNRSHASNRKCALIYYFTGVSWVVQNIYIAIQS